MTVARRLPVTASGLDLADSCLGSAVLHQVDEENPFAQGGTDFHAFLETARKRGREVALKEAHDDDRDAFAALDLAALPAGAESEVALGWDPETGRAVRYQLTGHRAYPDDGLLHGTTDLVGAVVAVNGRGVYVGDFKRYQIRTRAADSLQLGLYIVAAASLIDATEAEGALLVPRANGRWYVDRAQFDAIDLEAIADRIRALLSDIEDAQVRYREDGAIPRLAVGPHCALCRARRVCPAQAQPLALAARAQLEALAADELPGLEDVAERIAVLAPIEQGRLYERLKVTVDFIEMVLGVLRANAEAGALPLSGGKELRAIPWTTWIRSDKAKALIAALIEQLKTDGEIVAKKVPQVRPVVAKKKAA